MARTDYEAMLAHVRAHWPEEAGGLLAGEGEAVRQVYRVENIRHSPVEYELHPETQVRAMMDMEARGWDLLAIFHSHPHGPPHPSVTDVAQAYYPEAVYLIFAPETNGEWQMRGFRIEAGKVSDVDVVVR
jgi:proteasome lid subunit RPN8/RPN11